MQLPCPGRVGNTNEETKRLGRLLQGGSNWILWGHHFWWQTYFNPFQFSLALFQKSFLYFSSRDKRGRQVPAKGRQVPAKMKPTTLQLAAFTFMKSFKFKASSLLHSLQKQTSYARFLLECKKKISPRLTLTFSNLPLQVCISLLNITYREPSAKQIRPGSQMTAKHPLQTTLLIKSDQTVFFCYSCYCPTLFLKC